MFPGNFLHEQPENLGKPLRSVGLPPQSHPVEARRPALASGSRHGRNPGRPPHPLFHAGQSRGSVRGAAELLEWTLRRQPCHRRAGTRLRHGPVRAARGRGLVPTDAGHMLARYVKRQQDIQDSFFSEIDSLRKAERGHIDLVLGEGFVELMFDRVLPGYWRSHPEVTLDIDVARTSEIAQRIIDDQAYIGLVFQPPTTRGCTHYCGRTHPRHRARRPSAHPPAPAAAADRSGRLSRRRHAGRLRRAPAHPGRRDQRTGAAAQVLTTSSFKALWQFAATGIGYALTPPIAVTADPARSAWPACRCPTHSEPGQPAGAEPGRPPWSPAARELLDHIVRGIALPDGATSATPD